MPEQIFQVATKALIRNGSGQILMIHIPEWSGNAAHWDLPGGRMDQGESPLDTLKRELEEEIGCSFTGQPKQLMTFLTNITIPVGKDRVPLLFIVYEASLAQDTAIQLDPDSAEDGYKWFSPAEAAKEMEYKFPKEFCDLVSDLLLA